MPELYIIRNRPDLAKVKEIFKLFCEPLLRIAEENMTHARWDDIVDRGDIWNFTEIMKEVLSPGEYLDRFAVIKFANHYYQARFESLRKNEITKSLITCEEEVIYSLKININIQLIMDTKSLSLVEIMKTTKYIKCVISNALGLEDNYGDDHQLKFTTKDRVSYDKIVAAKNHANEWVEQNIETLMGRVEQLSVQGKTEKEIQKDAMEIAVKLALNKKLSQNLKSGAKSKSLKI